MDHHKGLSASASVDGFENSYYYGRRPTNIYIPRFKNVDKKDAGFLRGYHYGGGASRGRDDGNNTIGAALKESLTEPGGWYVDLYAFGECLSYTDNRVTLNHNKTDKWGRPLLSINCEFRENEKAMHADIGKTAAEMLERAGFKDISISNEISYPGNANHEMGTARMGLDPKTSVLNSFNQMHEVKNIFITDGSCMASSSCVNPSLTYMALTARACDYAVKEMRKLNI
jgi:choline dehydrogenase-like flavoprotein